MFLTNTKYIVTDPRYSVFLSLIYKVYSLIHIYVQEYNILVSYFNVNLN